MDKNVLTLERKKFCVSENGNPCLTNFCRQLLFW